MIRAITVITTAEITAPQRPLIPKATKYCITSCPEANPAPMMMPTNASATFMICPIIFRLSPTADSGWFPAAR